MRTYLDSKERRRCGLGESSADRATRSARRARPFQRLPHRWQMADRSFRAWNSACTHPRHFEQEQGVHAKVRAKACQGICPGHAFASSWTFGQDGIAGLSPGIHSAEQGLCVLEAAFLVFFCHTGSCGFMRSGTVKDKLALFQQSRNKRLELNWLT